MRIRELVTIGVPLDLGAGGRRGVDMGPSAIRYAGLGERVGGLVGHHEDRGDIPAPLRETATPGDAHARYLEPIAATCAELSTVVESVASADGFPLVLGGDHSVAMGTLGGLAAARGAGGVIWLDAHADVNRPETTPSGNVHGMPLAAVLGRAGERFEAAVGATRLVDPERVALIGTRDVDPGERDLIHELDLAVFTMSEIDRRGVEPIVREAIDRVGGAPFIHVSLDMDVVDPAAAPGVGTPVRGGLSYREAHLAMELLAEAGVADALEVVEVNPILDHENSTAALAVELIASALGERIL